MLKLAYKYFGYRYRQHRRKTSEKVVVETVYGPVRGVKRISCWDDSYYSFEKIPFAKPPVGELRFTDPQPPEPWTKAKNCTREAAVPLQFNHIFNRLQGKEDSLYLNVYTTHVKPAVPRPVMVWIYGGGFESGGATKVIYSPEYFMHKEVVFVSFNYRVGALGFLSLKDPKLKTPGNAGLKDQVMALKWVKKNIAKFGGDPENVTIFGESAGGASVHFLTLTEQTKGLFHKAILMSGTALCPWSTVPDHDWAYRLAKEIGYSGDHNEANILGFLRKANGSAICKANCRILTTEERRNRLSFAHGPVIEPYISEQCIVSKEPRLMARETWSNSIPIMLGGNSFEGLLLYTMVEKDPSILTQIEGCEYLVPLELGLDRRSEKCKELGLQLKKEHFGDNEPSMFSYLNLLSYKLFWHGIHRTIQSRLHYASAPTYLYRFDFDSKNFNHFRNLVCGKGVRGVCHADELTYIFNNMFGTLKHPGSKEYTTLQRMIGMWSEFAYNSDPNFAGIEPVIWKPLKKDDNPIKCINISEDVHVIDLPEIEGIKVWDGLFPDVLRKVEDPQPPKPWTNARNCSREAAGPLQLNYIFHIFDGQEDCLYVNVYTKNVQPNAPRPVMVWIYGGGFENGAATTLIYNPEYLLSKDVVVVTFNYRVGVLGFLSLKDPKLKTPGNAGLKDQVMALKWVKENIAKFGGDPENVTIFGESAGGASVHFLMMTERTKGLFHKAILMSGTALCPWSTVPDHDWARRLANEMGYSGNNNEANILSFLKKARGRAICRANSRLLNTEEKQNMIFFPHGPVIEPYISDQCIISKDPRLMAREGWGNEIPILLGGSSFEGLLLHSIIKKDPSILKKLNDCEYLVPLELGLDRNSAKCNELGLRLKKEYFGDKKPAMFSFLNLMSYKFFWHGIHRTVQSRMKYASAPTYLYRFDFDSEHYNHYRTIFCGKGVRGVCHCDILTYVFHNLFGTAQPGTKEFTTIQRMIGIWSEFAYKSDPNFAGIEPIVWKPIGKDENPIRCVNIAENVEVIELPEINGIKVWDSLYPEGMLI